MTNSPLKSALKDFFLFWKPSLARRLTLSFTIFGLVIGYAVFIYLAVSSTNTFIKLASESVGEYLAYMSRDNISEHQGELLKFIDQRMTNMANAAKVMQVIFPPLKFDLYFQSGGSWQHTYEDAQKVVKTEKIIDPAFSQSLEKAKAEKSKKPAKDIGKAEEVPAQPHEEKHLKDQPHAPEKESKPESHTPKKTAKPAKKFLGGIRNIFKKERDSL